MSTAIFLKQQAISQLCSPRPCGVLDTVLSLPVGEDFAAAGSAHRKPTAIILEPSKDLAEQTHDFMVRFKQYLTQPQLRCELLIGGTNPKQGSRALEEGVDIITGTPGNAHMHQSDISPVDSITWYTR